jgi:hypothetical protein
MPIDKFEEADIKLLKLIIEHKVPPEKVHVHDWLDRKYSVASIAVDDRGEIYILLDGE